jgi:hypothetical protein
MTCYKKDRHENVIGFTSQSSIHSD